MGEFKEGMRQGCGKNQGQLNYDGEWFCDLPHGSGVLKEENIEIMGQFIKGEVDEKT